MAEAKMSELEHEEKLVKSAVANIPTGPEISENAKTTSDEASVSQKRRRLKQLLTERYKRACAEFLLSESKWRNNLHGNETVSSQYFEDYCDAFARYIVAALDTLEPTRAAQAKLAIVNILIKYRSRGLSNTL